MFTKDYVNKSGQLFFLNTLNRKILSDPNKVHTFSDEDVEKDSFLRNLIKNRYLVEIEPSGEDQEIKIPSIPGEENTPVIQKPITRSEDDSAIARFPPMRGEKEHFVAEAIGAPQNQVSIDPKGMSRFAEDRAPKEEETLAIDPNRVSRYQETMDSLRHDTHKMYGQTQQSVVESQSFESNILPPMPSASSTVVPDKISQKKTSNDTGLEVWWCGPANDASGYGKMNRQCLEGLYKKGVKVELDLFKIPDFRCAVPITHSLDSMMKTRVPEDAPAVWGIMPPKYLYRGRKKILFTMMETSEIPTAFIEKCNQADELWLPSLYNMDSFERAGAKPKLVHMPLGVDTKLFKPMALTEDQKSMFSIKTRSFVFMSLFGWSLRKGVDILFKAYLEEFTGRDDVTLLIVSRKEGSSSLGKIGEIREQIKSYIDRWCPDPKTHPHIVHIGESIPEENLPVLYNMANCFLGPTRGEGFFLPACEAGSCELPVVATRCGGQLDFLNDDNSYLLDIDGFEIGNQEIKCISSYYENAPFAVLRDKTTNQLKETMRHILNNYGEAKEKAGKLRENLENNFTWDHLVEKIHNRLKAY